MKDWRSTVALRQSLRVHLLSARCAGERDVTTRGLGLLESVVGSESGHHVGMCGNEDPQTDPGTSNRVSMRAMVFIRVIRFERKVRDDATTIPRPFEGGTG
jgi:hypothetical protein